MSLPTNTAVRSLVPLLTVLKKYAVSKIKLNHSSLKLKPGETKTLTASVSSGNAPTWTSKKTSIATINQKGVVKAKKAGTTIITASEDGASASCTVTVTK